VPSLRRSVFKARMGADLRSMCLKLPADLQGAYQIGLIEDYADGRLGFQYGHSLMPQAYYVIG
jgi:hypothetical protein